MRPQKSFPHENDKSVLKRYAFHCAYVDWVVIYIYNEHKIQLVVTIKSDSREKCTWTGSEITWTITWTIKLSRFREHFQKLAFSLRNDRPFTCGQEVETKRNQISCSRGQTNFHLALICHVSILIFLYQRTGEYGKASLMADLRLCGPWDRSFRPRWFVGN